MNNILFNVEMTKAVLDGRKTQMRRAIKAKIENSSHGTFNINMSDEEYVRIGVDLVEEDLLEFVINSSEAKYKVGEVVFIKEYFINKKNDDFGNLHYLASATDADVVCLENDLGLTWNSPHKMVESDARIFLKITDVRIEKLMDISDKDIFREGVRVPKDFKKTAMWSDNQQRGSEWINLWNKTAPKGYKWEDNPFVFCYTFERVNRDD